MTHLGPIGRLARPQERTTAASPELQMIQVNPSYRFISEGARRRVGTHSVSLLALKPVSVSRHTSDPDWVVALVSHKRPGEEGPINSTTTKEVER